MPISKVSEVGYITAAYIREDYQRNGVVKRLKVNFTNYFVMLGIEYVELNFIYENIGARKCWEALGYNIFRVQARKKSL